MQKVRLFKNYKFICVKPLNEILRAAIKQNIAEDFNGLIRKGYSIKPLKQSTFKRAA